MKVREVNRRTYGALIFNHIVADRSMDTGFPEELALDSYKENGVALDMEATQASLTASFEEIFRRYESMVFNLLFRVLGDREEALDVSQEVFFSVYRKLHRFRGESSLKTWIYRIALNRAANRCRWWNRLRRRGTLSLDEHLSKDEGSRAFGDSLKSTGMTPEEELLINEKRRDIEHSLLRLPVQQRMAVIMRDVEGLPYEEIAASLQVSLGTVKSRIARGREELKRRLNGTLR
jgi:RNA polymerase sigma-70 factor (ECF subfamily)